MALPKINEQMKYSLIVPSNNKKITFRPFLVKEQKVLLTALEAGNNDNVLRAILDTVEACVYDEENISNLPTYDIEYIFTKIRAKSVGEVSNILINCEECGENNEVSVDLETIKVDKVDNTKKVKLNDDYTLVLRHPSYENLLLLDNEEDNLSNIIYNMSISCMYELLSKDEIIKFDDEKQEDIVEFLDGLTTEQFEKVMEFVSQIPSIKSEVSYICKKCSNNNKTTLSGIKDFF
jgi:predicted house-cleaning noncanonical NTP pyrophosphatase (MazG superfamily)